MKRCLPAITIVTFAAVACGSKARAKARIFERRAIGENSLLLKYEYTADGKNYIDSMVMKNTVINSDTINLILNPSDPGNALPELDSFYLENR